MLNIDSFTADNITDNQHSKLIKLCEDAQIDYWENLGYKKVWLTFNEYNHRLINFLKRISEGKASHFGAGIHSPKNLYKDLKWYDDLVEIQYTNQVVAELDIESYRATHSS
jgi:hypothetical protein